VTLPDGSTQTVPLGTGAREFVFAGTASQGMYQVRIGTNRVEFAANLLDPAESDTRPSEAIDLGRRGVVAAAPGTRANVESWRWFAVLVLGLLLAEWWWFHRRT
jgi:hypothetical protein